MHTTIVLPHLYHKQTLKLPSTNVQPTQEQQEIIMDLKEQNKSLEVQINEMKKMMELQQAQIEKLVGQSNNND